MIIGIDLGGTKIAAGLVADGRIIKTARRPTGKERGKEHILAQISAIVGELSEGNEIAGIGLGTPGYVHDSILEQNSIEDLNGLDIQEMFGAAIPVAAANDANCFTLGEHRYGVGKGTTNLVGITMGTGLGTGLVLNDEMYEGSHKRAPEMGHWMMDANGQEWEVLLHGDAITERHERNGGQEKWATQIWESDDTAAKETLRETSRLLATFTANIILAFDPDMVVLGGGVSHNVLARAANDWLEDFGFDPILKMSVLKEDAAILGAASLLE